jgi:8-oxo-dGTP diphosphatase
MEPRARVCGQLVGEQISVSGHGGIAHFDGPAVGVIGRADQPEHRDASGEAEQPRLLRSRHARADLLGETCQRVTALLKASVDAAWAGVGISDRSAARQVSWNIRQSSLHRFAVKRVPPRTDDNTVTVGQAKTLGYLGRRAGFADLDHVYCRLRIGLLGFRQERGLAFLTVPLRKAIRRQTTHRRLRADIHAPAMLGSDETLVLEHSQSIAGGHPGDAVVVHERDLGRELLALSQPALADRSAQVVGDLPVDSTVAAGVDVLSEHTVAAHVAFAPQLVHTSTTVSVPGEDQKISTSQAKHSVSVAGVIVDKHNRALLIRRRDNLHWEPPGGVLELDEGVEDGLRREVREETGLTVDPIALTGVYKNMTRGIIALVFLCRHRAGKLSTNAEVTEFYWATPEEVAAMASEAYSIRILDAMANDVSPAIRLHDGTGLL